MGWFQKEPDTVNVPLQEARNLYATISLIVRDRVKVIDALLLERGDFNTEFVIQFTKDKEALKALDFEIRRKLENPKAELDTEKIIRILEVMAKLVGAVL